MEDTSEVPALWKNKVVYVYLRNGGGSSLETGIALSDVRFEVINGRVFLAGTALSDPSDWVADLPLLVLWEEVIHVVIVDSPDEYNLRSRRARALLAHATASDEEPQ